MKLSDFDIVIINSSAGKDSLASIYEICRMADEQGFPREKIVVSHQDLGAMEWEGTKELARKQAQHFGLVMLTTRQKDIEGNELSLLDYVRKRGKWPSRNQRFCTSEFKRGPGGRVITLMTKGMKKSKVLYVFGFRASESPARSKKRVRSVNKRFSTKSRQVIDFLPIHKWSDAKVWATIKAAGLPYHFAYNLKMPRLSCVFCIFSPFDALVIAGKRNPKLLDQYIEVEEEINHTFTKDFSLKQVRNAIKEGYTPKNVPDWKM